MVIGGWFYGDEAETETYKGLRLDAEIEMERAD